jgi:hypothetical protein
VVDYHLVRKVKSNKFNVDHLNQYSLYFLLGKQHVKFCVLDTKANACLLLEDYLIGDNDEPDEMVNTLQVLFESHHLLNAGFWNSVKLAFLNPKSVLVPSQVFDKESLPEYLKMNCELGADDSFYYFKHNTGKMVNVFAANKKIVNWFKQQYPNLNIHLLHYSSALIEAVPRQSDVSRQKSMSLFINIDSVDVLVHKNERLLYCNQFSYQSPEELLKYVVVVMDQLGLDPNVSKVQLWGNVNPQTEYFKILYKYIRNISFGKRPSIIMFSFEFDEIDEHLYFDLFGLYYCE